MNVLKVELIREIRDMCEYKVTYEESDIFTVKVVGKTCNYDGNEIKNIPESVLEFVDNWLCGTL